MKIWNFSTVKKSKKLMICLLILSMMTFGLWSGDSIQKVHADTYGDFSYSKLDGKVEITGYTGSSTDVKIPGTIDDLPVTSIGENAFSGKSITSLEIPEGTTRIGSYAFNNNDLTSVTIPDSVVSIGAFAFGSNAITSVNLPANLTIIEDGLFYLNVLLSSVAIPHGVTSIGKQAFASAPLTSIDIPASVKRIGESAFYSNRFKNVTIPASMENIGKVAFSSTTEKTIIVEGDSTVIEESALTNIGGSRNIIVGFQSSTAETYAELQRFPFVNILSGGVSYSPDGESVGKEQISTKVDIKVPADVSVTAEYKWSTDSSLPGWSKGEGTTLLSGNTITTPTDTGYWYLHVRVDDGKHIAGYSHSDAFRVLAPGSDNANLSSLVLSSGSLSPTFAMDEMSYSAEVEYSVGSIKVTPIVADPKAKVTVNDSVVMSGSRSEWIKLNEGRNSIKVVVTAQDGTTKNTYMISVTRAEGDFKYSILSGEEILIYEYKGTSPDVIIPETIDGLPVTIIGDIVFRNKHITSVKIPNSVITIRNRAFYGTKLKSVEIPPSVTTIEGYAFANNIDLESITFAGSSKLESIGDYAFQHSGLTSIEIPNSVTSIGDYAFSNNILASVKIPNSVESIGDYAFQHNRLESVELPGKLTVIAEGLFSENILLQSVTIPEGVISIGNLAFLAAPLTSLNLPTSVTSIGDKAFQYNGLTSLNIPAKVTSVGTFAFYQNNGKLKTVIIESDSTIIGENAITNLDRHPITFVAFDSSTAKTYADSMLFPFVNILSAGVSFSPNGESVGKEEITTIVENKVPTAVSVTSEYKWSTDSSLPGWNKGEGTTLQSGDTITTPTDTGDWYLHVRVDDAKHTAGYSRSDGFRVIAPKSNNANLNGLVLSSGVISPTFGAGKIGYTASVANVVNSITVTPTLAENTASVKVNGVAVTSGIASSAIRLIEGSNTITVITTAQDGTTTKTYTITVTRATAVLSNNANLSNLELSSGVLSPTFAAGEIDYTASVANGVESITVTPMLAENTASVKVNGVAVTSGIASGAIRLIEGSNTITVITTAQDGTTTKTYTITVTRATAVLSNNAELSNLGLSSGVLSPTFSAGEIDYTASVANGVESITVTPMLAENTASVKVNGVAVTSGIASGAISLIEGSNTITVITTAQDGITTKTYTITVTRATAVLSNNADLSNLELSSGVLSPTFVAGEIDYTASVANGVESITVTPMLAENTASVKVNGVAVTSGIASGAIRLIEGSNTITVITTAQDGTTTKTYTITVTRATAVLSNNADLSNLELSSGVLSPTFVAGKIGYTASVANVVNSITVTPMLAENTASVKVNGVVVTSGIASGAISLIEGSNTITVVTTAQDGKTTKTYTITVTRATSSSGGSTDGGASSPSTGGGKVTSTDGTLILPIGSSGEVSIPNGVTVVIPAGASDKEINIKIDELTGTDNLLSDEEAPISPIYEITKNFSENFNKLVTVTFIFDPSSLQENQYPAIFYYDEVKKEWVQIAGGKVDGNKITVEVGFFAKFAVMAVSKDEQPGTDYPTFSDIMGHWAESSIKQAVSNGIVKGYKDGTFKPNGVVTRAEFVVMLMKVLKPQEEVTKLTFIDSDKIGTWAIDAIEQAVQSGIVQGYSDDSFRPNAEITRTEMAVMIAKALALKVEEHTVTDFTDDAVIPSWAKAQIAALKNLGLLSGKGNNEFAPNDKATRAEAVTILLKVVAKQSK